LSEGQETIELTLTNAAGGVVIGSPNRIVIALRDNPERHDLLAEEHGVEHGEPPFAFADALGP
jgi:hypothetical protein